MTPLVLVHGAWQTAGTWDLVAPKLQAAGYIVFNARLTGLEGDSADLTADVTLDTHIGDVVRLLEHERLEGVTLVGHSYAGMVVTGVAERASGSIGRLVYVDAFIPDDGQAAMQLLPEAIQTMFREQARAQPGGWRLPASEQLLDLWGLEAGPAREFVRSKLTDFSINCFERAVSLPHNRASEIDRTYIACTAEKYPARAVFGRFAERARRERWRYHELPTGHDCHVEMPEEFCRALRI